MLPMLRYRRDPVLIHPVTSPLKRYDVAVYNRGDSYVIHRIIEVRPDCYVFRGDNCTGKETVPKDPVLGVGVGLWYPSTTGSTGSTPASGSPSTLSTPASSKRSIASDHFVHTRVTRVCTNGSASISSFQSVPRILGSMVHLGTNLRSS